MTMIRATALNVFRHPIRALRLPQHSFVHPRLIPRFGDPRNFSSSRSSRRIVYTRFGGYSNQEPRDQSRRPSSKRWILYSGVAGALYYVTHLEQVPETGRWRFMAISPDTEETIGEMLRDAILKEHEKQILPPNHIISRHVRRIVAQILSASSLGHIRRGSAHDLALSNGSSQPWDANELWDPDAQNQNTFEAQREWEVVVVHDPKVINAMAVPGLIVVFTGILPLCRDERGLSAVLAHEIGHVVARHSAERISSEIINLLFLFLLQFMSFGMFNIASAQHFLFDLPNSRTQEYEADKIGLSLMSRACYDPKGAVEMFGRLARLQPGRSDVDFFDTHPSSAKRVEELSKLLPEAYAVLQENPDCAGIQDRLMGAFRSLNVRNRSFDEMID
ncbi:hypothetical protein H2248_001697 [Termitomyces sp. 'cryptogamus']|nr:hypothetical protein H2248_001697 [Termitomyces sp. 'cryptogamus']